METAGKKVNVLLKIQIKYAHMRGDCLPKEDDFGYNKRSYFAGNPAEKKTGGYLMKKLIALMMCALLVLGMVSFASADGYKIAIMTGTTSQGEEEYYAAKTLAETYPGVVLHDTYPDAFSSEVETTISKLIAFASDPEVKSIIFVQAVQGATAAYTQILNEMGRDDILLIAGVPAEDPADISAAADIVLANDEIGCGYQVADLAKEWECDVLVH